MSHDNTTNTQTTLVQQFSAATVIGLGATGYSVVRYLRARGLTVAVVDSRAEPALANQLKQEFPEVLTYFGSLDCSQVTEADLLIVSPGLSLKEPALQTAKYNGAVIAGDIELFLQENRMPLIAITGSNGKSTVTSLVGYMCNHVGCQALVAGNIGKPALDALTDGQHYDVAVLELSSFQLETTGSVPAQAAAILNISEDHMDRYDSMGDYTLAKARILRGAERAVLPRHEERLAQITNVNERLTFGLDAPISDTDFGVVRKKSGRWLMRGDQRIMLLRDVPLVGLHNVLNVLSAFALLDFLALPTDQLIDAVKTFEGLPHRMQTVAEKNNIKWVNDSKATNVGAAQTALQNLEGNIIWLAGGEGKGADFSDLQAAVAQSVKHAILFGTDAKNIRSALGDAVAITIVDSLDDAVTLAAQQAEAGDTVLLSPACASFDMFDNFEHRGEQFARAVNAIATASESSSTPSSKGGQ